MTDFHFKGGAVAQAQFRADTKKLGVMAGVTQVPKRVKCYCCERMRTESTGQHTDAGFLCGMCHSPRRGS